MQSPMVVLSLCAILVMTTRATHRVNQVQTVEETAGGAEKAERVEVEDMEMKATALGASRSMQLADTEERHVKPEASVEPEVVTNHTSAGPTASYQERHVKSEAFVESEVVTNHTSAGPNASHQERHVKSEASVESEVVTNHTSAGPTASHQDCWDASCNATADFYQSNLKGVQERATPGTPDNSGCNLIFSWFDDGWRKMVLTDAAGKTLQNGWLDATDTRWKDPDTWEGPGGWFFYSISHFTKICDCTCSHGTAATGPSCTSSGANLCAACDQYYGLNDEKSCVYRVHGFECDSAALSGLSLCLPQHVAEARRASAAVIIGGLSAAAVVATAAAHAQAVHAQARGGLAGRITQVAHVWPEPVHGTWRDDESHEVFTVRPKAGFFKRSFLEVMDIGLQVATRLPLPGQEAEILCVGPLGKCCQQPAQKSFHADMRHQDGPAFWWQGPTRWSLEGPGSSSLRRERQNVLVLSVGNEPARRLHRVTSTMEKLQQVVGLATHVGFGLFFLHTGVVWGATLQFVAASASMLSTVPWCRSRFAARCSALGRGVSGRCGRVGRTIVFLLPLTMLLLVGVSNVALLGLSPQTAWGLLVVFAISLPSLLSMATQTRLREKWQKCGACAVSVVAVVAAVVLIPIFAVLAVLASYVLFNQTDGLVHAIAVCILLSLVQLLQETCQAVTIRVSVQDFCFELGTSNSMRSDA